MAFTADPFAWSGTPDTSGQGGPTLTYLGAHDTVVTANPSQESEGQGEGTGAPEGGVDTSVATVCPAVRQSVASLQTAAAARLRPTQRSYNRTY